MRDDFLAPQTPTEPFAARGDRSSVIGETAADGRAPGLATTGAPTAEQARRALPFADPDIDDAPIELDSNQAYAWARGYTKAKADIRKALVEACSHGDMHFGTWPAERCPFPGCTVARALDGLDDPPSTVPDHLPDNDESRGHGSVR